MGFEQGCAVRKIPVATWRMKHEGDGGGVTGYKQGQTDHTSQTAKKTPEKYVVIFLRAYS